MTPETAAFSAAFYFLSDLSGFFYQNSRLTDKTSLSHSEIEEDRREEEIEGDRREIEGDRRIEVGPVKSGTSYLLQGKREQVRRDW